MATFLTTWNPELIAHDTKVHELRIRATELAYDPDKCGSKTTVNHAWSTGVRKGGIAIGDRIFLLMTGKGRGIVASGYATSEVKQPPHFRYSARASQPYVYVEWDLAVPTDKALRTSLLDDYGRASGIQLPESVAAEVERLWANHIRDFYGEMPIHQPPLSAP